MENLNWSEWIAIAVGVYELLSRVIKTSKTWSIIGNVLSFLQKISTSLDRRHVNKIV